MLSFLTSLFRNNKSPESGLNSDYKMQFDDFKKALRVNDYIGSSIDEYKYVVDINAFNSVDDVLKHIYSGFVKEAAEYDWHNKKLQLAMFLAQCMHESGGLKRIIEWGYEDGNRDRKKFAYIDSNHHSANGKSYHGRGFIQLSWNYNYNEASHDLFGDDRLVRDPDLVIEGNNPWKTSFWFWNKRVSWHPKVKAGCFGASTNIVNGIECKYSLDGGSKNVEPSAEERAKKRFEIYKKVFYALSLDKDFPVPRECCCYQRPQQH